MPCSSRSEARGASDGGHSGLAISSSRSALQLRDSAGLAPDFPRLVALCGCANQYKPEQDGGGGQRNKQSSAEGGRFEPQLHVMLARRHGHRSQRVIRQVHPGRLTVDIGVPGRVIHLAEDDQAGCGRLRFHSNLIGRVGGDADLVLRGAVWSGE